MAANIVIDDSDFKNALSRYLREYPREVSESLRIRARLLFTRIAKHMPPASKSQGLTRVRADIRKAANPLNPDSFKNPQVKKVIRAGNLQDVRAIVQNSKSGMANQRVDMFSPAQHILARNKDTGRVNQPRKILVLGFTQWKQYVRLRQKRVGLLRANFSLPVTVLGGNVPGWYNGDKVAGSAAVRDETMRTDAPSFTFKSLLPYASRYQSNIESSMGFESKALLKDLELALKRAGQVSNF